MMEISERRRRRTGLGNVDLESPALECKVQNNGAKLKRLRAIIEGLH